MLDHQHGTPDQLGVNVILPRSPSQHMVTAYRNTPSTSSPILPHAPSLLPRLPPPTPLTRQNPGPLVSEGTSDTTTSTTRANHNPERDIVRPHQPATATQKGTADPTNLTIRPTNPHTQPSNNHPLSRKPNAAQKKPSMAVAMNTAHALLTRTNPPRTSLPISLLEQPIGEQQKFATGTARTMTPSTSAITPPQRHTMIRLPPHPETSTVSRTQPNHTLTTYQPSTITHLPHRQNNDPSPR